MEENKSLVRPHITPREAAQLSCYTEGSLANLRHHKKGCPYFKRGSKVLYDREQFLAWCRANPVNTIE